LAGHVAGMEGKRNKSTYKIYIRNWNAKKWTAYKYMGGKY
jgi:hypothetical protein